MLFAGKLSVSFSVPSISIQTQVSIQTPFFSEGQSCAAETRASAWDSLQVQGLQQTFAYCPSEARRHRSQKLGSEARLQMCRLGGDV